MAFSFFGKKDKKPAEAPAPEAKAQPAPPKVQAPPSSGTLPPVKPPQPTGLMPATLSAPGAVTTQPMGMVRPSAPGLKPARPGVGNRSTQRIVLPTPPGAKGSQTRSLPGGPNANGRINLPAGVILRCLPTEVLASDLTEFEANGSAATEIGLPMNMILSQLPSGKIEVPLQDLVPHFPPGFLQPTESIGAYLQNIINLPLMDVVMRIPPDQLALRPDQKEVDAAVINMADPFTEEILREQAEAARRAAQTAPNIIEESQAPQEEFVPSHQTVPVKSIAPPRRPTVEPLNPSRTAATTLATPPSAIGKPPPGPAATRPANSPTPMPMHQQLSISAPIRPLAPAPAPPLATTPIPAFVPPAPPPPLAVPTIAAAPTPAPISAPIPVPSRSSGPLPLPTPLPTPVPFATPAAEAEELAAEEPALPSSTAPVPPVPRHTGPIPAPPPPRHTTTLPTISRRTGAIPTLDAAEPTTDATAEAIAAGTPDPGADDLQRLAALAMTELGDSNEEEKEEATMPEPSMAPTLVMPPRPVAEPIPDAALKDPSAFILTPPTATAPVPLAPSFSFTPPPPASVTRQPMPSAPQKSLATKTGPIPMTTPEGEAVVAFNINTCTADDLVAHIEGVPQLLAEAIVKHRTKIGSFKKIEELLDVPGMTNEVYTNLTGEPPPSKAPAQSVNELLGFSAGQTVSLKDVTDRISCWPDVTGCLLSQANGLSLVGSAPAGFDKAAIVAFVPRMFESINKSFSEVAGQETDALLLPTVGNSFHLFRSGDLYLIIMSRLPQMPERHMKVARMVLAALSTRRE